MLKEKHCKEGMMYICTHILIDYSKLLAALVIAHSSCVEKARNQSTKNKEGERERNIREFAATMACRNGLECKLASHRQTCQNLKTNLLRV